ncbi:MAG: hypothetical protein IJS26_06035 [Alphaproteobacteria bacterium]|nr:hypothetical protein [Alphaproteobacteria bacterium]
MARCLLKEKLLPSKMTLWVVLAVVFGIVVCSALIFSAASKKDESALEELRLIAQNIRKHYQKSVDYRGLNTSVALEKDLIPAQMVRKGKIYSRLKNEIVIGADEKGTTVAPAGTFFSVSYTGINQKKCAGLISEPFDVSLGLVSIRLLTAQSEREFSYGGEFTLPVSEPSALKFCQNKNTVVLTFE